MTKQPRPSGAKALVGAQGSAPVRVRQRAGRGSSASAPATPPSHVRFAASLLAELCRRDPDGSRLALTADVGQVVARVADRVLDPAVVWQEGLGAFYDTDGVRQLLGRDDEPVSRQAVHKRKGLLALTTGSGQVVYPAFQFSGRTLAPGMDRVLEVLSADVVSRWTLASWLVSPDVELDGDRPIDVLFSGQPAAVDRVVQAASHWAAQLAA